MVFQHADGAGAGAAAAAREFSARQTHPLAVQAQPYSGMVVKPFSEHWEQAQSAWLCAPLHLATLHDAVPKPSVQLKLPGAPEHESKLTALGPNRWPGEQLPQRSVVHGSAGVGAPHARAASASCTARRSIVAVVLCSEPETS